MRKDAPGRIAAARGSFPSLPTEAARTKAVQDLEADFCADSAKRAAAMKWRTIVKAAGKWGLHPLPLTADVLLAVGATLKAGGYRSAEAYISLLKVTAERSGQVIAPDIRRLATDIVRSCLRGLGGPVKALALPMMRLAELPSSDEPWFQGDP